MDFVFDKYINKLPHYLVDNERNSLFTLLIKYDLEQYLVKLINTVGKNIFQHIPMITINIYNLQYVQNLSNGMELYWACKKNLPVIADFLIDNKLGKYNFIDLEGNTCFIFACKYKMKIVAEKLIKILKPMYINQTNNENKCAYEYAKSNCMEKICVMIEDINKKFTSIQDVSKSTTEHIIKSISSNTVINENKPIKVKIISNPLNMNPFENSNLKNSEMIKMADWVKKQSMANK
jgi:ankyrin repeat protein